MVRFSDKWASLVESVPPHVILATLCILQNLLQEHMGLRQLTRVKCDTALSRKSLLEELALLVELLPVWQEPKHVGPPDPVIPS